MTIWCCLSERRSAPKRKKDDPACGGCALAHKATVYKSGAPLSPCVRPGPMVFSLLPCLLRRGEKMSISQMLLPEFDQEMASTRKLLERVPDDRFSYKPHEKSMELGRLASHIAELPNWGATALNTEGLNLEPGMKPYLAKSREDLLQAFDKNVADARARIAAATDQELGAIWTLTFAGKTMFSMH